MLFMGLRSIATQLIIGPSSKLKNSNDLRFEQARFNQDYFQLVFNKTHCDGVPLLIKKEKDISSHSAEAWLFINSIFTVRFYHSNGLGYAA